MGWDWTKLDITGPDKVNLSMVLLKGKYILNGTLNQTWYKYGEYCVNGDAQRTPAGELVIDFRSCEGRSCHVTSTSVMKASIE